MISYTENYETDIDGNCGQTTWVHEIDNSDTDDIIAQLEEAIADGSVEDFNESIEITLIEPISELDVVFTVTIADYISKDKFNTLIKKAYDD